MNATPGLHAEFLGPPGERILALVHVPRVPVVSGCVLIVPPFAEELNKSRHLMSQLARSVAQRGFAASIVDVYGTGDSEGEFERATWERWVSDVCAAAEWCAGKGFPVTHTVGVRLGCSLAAAAVARLAQPLRSAVFWQPVPEGSRLVEQFLRLRVAASMMDQGKRETVKDLRQRLAAGETLEIAGYELSGELIAALDAVRIAELATPAIGQIHWMEVVREAKPPTPPTAAAMESLRGRGCVVDYGQVIGDPFWSATELVAAPELVSRTTAVLCAAA